MQNTASTVILQMPCKIQKGTFMYISMHITSAGKHGYIPLLGTHARTVMNNLVNVHMQHSHFKIADRIKKQHLHFTLTIIFKPT